MRLRSQLVIVLFLLVMSFSSCKKKKPPVPQPREQAPTISAPTLPPEPLPPPELPPPSAKPPVAAKPKPKPKKTTAKKTAPKPEPAKPPKTVIEENGRSEPGQLSASLPPDEAEQQHQSTLQMQQVAEANLRSITRTLSAEEESMVQQVRIYLQQSRAADADGDTERAYNLALKARLLSGELAKR